MTCRRIRRSFTAWLDGRMDAAGREELERHLASCATCRAALASWEEAARALRTIGPTPVPTALAERAFRRAVTAEPTPPLASWFVAAGRPAALAGAVAALVVWAGVLAVRPRAPRAEEMGVQDPIEVAVQLWAAEGGDAE